MRPIIKWSHPLAGNNEIPFAQLFQLANAKSGFFPIGNNGLWHGGVHFDTAVHASLTGDSVRCIADGEVIAYRIDSQYPTSAFTTRNAPFSTGFVLVRHRLEPPANPADTSTPPSLTLYSLYMHLQDWAGYQSNADQERPAFWTTHRVETQSSSLNVRAAPNTNSAILAKLPAGTRVRVAPGDGDFRKLLEIVDGTLPPNLSPDANGQLLGYLAAGFLRSEPLRKDQVVDLNPPMAIAAGALIGYPGLYQNQDDGNAEPLLHLEVFSCDDIPAYLKQIRQWAERLPRNQKTLLKVHAGASKLFTHRPATSTTSPPGASHGTVVGVDLIIPQSYLDALPADCKIVTGAQQGITHWWRLDGLLADAQGHPISGWLAEHDPITTRHSPWEWEGFDCIEDNTPPKASLAYFLNALLQLTDAERASYGGLIDKADKGPIKSRLVDIIDTNRDGALSTEEIHAALQKPWHAQSIAQLILRQESEWLWNKEKWQALDEFMSHDAAAWTKEKERIEKLSWWGELSRKNVISPNGLVWHFHPINLINQFKPSKPHPVIKINGLKIELDFLKIHETNEIGDNEIRETAANLNCEPGLIYAISKQESANSSFIEVDGEKIPSILYERHQFRNHSGNPAFGISHPEIYGSAYKRARRGRDGIYIDIQTGQEIHPHNTYGPGGRFQYERLMKAYLLNEDAALKACSWGKFQIMGFNHKKAGFQTVKDFTAAMALGESEHIKAFLKFARGNAKLIRGLREKNFEMIAEGHNGLGWRSINPEYAANIERFYNEYNRI